MSERVTNNASKTGENAAETATGTIPPRSVQSPLERDCAAPRYQSPVQAGLPSGHDSIRLLHQTVGNQAVGRLIQRSGVGRGKSGVDSQESGVKSQKSGGIQPKLTINKPDDIYEQEADRVSDQVMRMPDTAVRIQETGVGSQKSEVRGGNGIIQTKPG